MPHPTDASLTKAAGVEGAGMRRARWFVGTVFVLLGVSFVATTALVVWEFRDQDWLSIVLLHGHLWLFFPTLGLLALVAFHLPATIFTHMYWTRIPYGGLRYTIGALLAIAVSIGISWSLRINAGSPHIWQIAPPHVAADRGQPAGCDELTQSCTRAPVSAALTALRDAASTRFGVSAFARPCAVDRFAEPGPEFLQRRFCFASLRLQPGRECCNAQDALSRRLSDLGSGADARSLSDRLDVYLLPLKTFFVIVIVIIGFFLVVWRELLETDYRDVAPAIERALLIGAAAMLPWPFMDYAHLQALETLIGRQSPSMELRLSLVIAPWALLLLVFFLQRMGRKIERMGQLAGAVASVVALLRYEQLNDAAVRVVGVGAPWWIVPLLIAASLFGVSLLRWPKHLQRAINKVIGRAAEAGAGPPPGFSR